MELWQAIVGALLTGAVTGALSFVAAWVTMQKQVAVLTQRTDSLENAVHKDLKGGVEKLSTRCDNQDNRMREIEDRQSRMVHDEEFQVAMQTSTTAVNRLTEMVGRLEGILDAWGRGRSR